MHALNRYKNIAVVIVVIVVLFIAYSILTGSSEDATGSLLTTSEGGEEGGVERELVALLLELRSIEINDDVFRSPSFRSLQDFSKPIEPQPVGRPNPFAPIGR